MPSRNRLRFRDIQGDNLYKDVDRMLDELTREEIRQAYIAVRDTLRKRVQRIEAAGFESPMTQRFQSTYHPIATLEGSRSVRNSQRLEARLVVSMLRDLQSPTGSVQGIRESQSQTLETLHLRGIKWVNEENIRDFGEFMEYARQVGLALIYDSDRIARDIGKYLDKNPGGTPTEWAEAFEGRLKQSEYVQGRVAQARSEAATIAPGQLRNAVRQRQNAMRDQRAEARERRRRKS